MFPEICDIITFTPENLGLECSYTRSFFVISIVKFSILATATSKNGAIYLYVAVLIVLGFSYSMQSYDLRRCVFEILVDGLVMINL